MAPSLSSTNHLLSALPHADYARLSPLLRTIDLAPRLMLFKQGDALDTIYFPEDGVCSLTVTMTDGRIAEVGLVGREGAAGYLAGFGQEFAAHDAMVQIPGGTAQTLSRRDFQAEMARNGALHAAMNRYLLAISVLTAVSVACNALHTAEERCARWLLHASDRVGARFDLSHDYLAMMLGVRRPTATLVAGVLQRAGLIRYRRTHMEITDRQGLENAACKCYAMAEEPFKALRAAV